MAEVIRMPLLSDTMKEGVIAGWNVKVGDKISADDPIAEVETDKATMEVIPYVEGTVLYIGPKKGEAAKVNEVIAVVGEEGESYEDLLQEEKKSAKDSDQSDKQEEDSPEKESSLDKEKSDTEENKEEKKTDKGALEEAQKNATAIRMPLLSDTMKEGKIVSWNKKEGDKVEADDVLAEVETDKATMEVIGYVEGTLLHIGVKEGEAAKVNAIIAIVGKEGTDIQPLLDAEGSEEKEKEAPKEADKEKDKDKAEEKVPAAKKDTAPKKKTDSGSSKTSEGRIKVSPLARKLAEEKNIDLEQVSGTGDGGRIIKRDIDNFKPQEVEKAAQAPAFAPAGEEGYFDTPLSQMRKTIARRLGESKFTAPHFYLTIEVNMDTTIKVRKAMNELSPVKISFNDIIIKASAMALRQHPAVNSSWLEKDSAIRTYKHIHVGSAVAMEEGLIVPVIKFADQKTLSQIAGEAKELYAKANNKKLQPAEFSGNTFTVSNLGMMGIEEFTAIINPPDACILAVGGIKETVVVKNGEFTTANIMKLTLSCDHRVVDGAVGARFLQTLKQLIQNPATMLV